MFCKNMELFIKAVYSQPCLWNIENKDYRDGDKKDMAWKRISVLNIEGVTDVKTAKAEWKKLRDNHHDSLKRKKGEINIWKFAEQMEFLIPYMKNRKKSRNLINTDTLDPLSLSTPEQKPIIKIGAEYKNYQINLDTELKRSVSTRIDDEEENSLTSLEDTTLAFVPKRKKRTDDNQILNLIKDVQIQLREVIERKVKPEKKPIEIFFDSMAQQTKNMPSFIQSRIKKKVLDAVCEAEEEMELFNANSK